VTALAVGPDNMFIDESGMKAAIERAEAAMAERNWGRATSLWREVLDEFGDQAPRGAYLRLSKALRYDGHVTAARAILLDRAERDSEDYWPRLELARLAATQADWEGAVKLWEDVLGLVSIPTAEMANGLAGALCQLGRLREADDVLHRTLAAGIDRSDLESVFYSDVLCTQFLDRFAQTASGTKEQGFEEIRIPKAVEEAVSQDSDLEWYRVAVGSRRLRDASGRNAAVTAPSAISVDGWPGWGNNVWQLIHALEVAEKLEVPRIYIPPAWYLEGDFPIYFRGHEVIQSDSPSPEERLVLHGAFMLLTQLTGTESPYLRLAELRPFTRFRDGQPLKEDDLVIHIRAGDIFEKEGGHPFYGQPPLAYYLMILRQRPWRSVHVVYQDDANPVLQPLLDHLNAEGIEPRTVVTGRTSTIEFLLTAKTIVAGRGTFIPAVAGLSSNLRRLYSFEKMTGLGGRWDDPPGIEQIVVIDDPGDYRRAIMSRNWENRPDQLELMLHYPESALRVVPPDGAL
jgi:tetratricopeptide (TPR) repeat protein